MTFYIYDKKKSHGYFYSLEDNLYHYANRHTLHKFSENVQHVEQDLRPLLNKMTNAIPISNKLVYIPSTKTLRPREAEDYFTYELDYSPHKSYDIEPVLELLKQILPNSGQRDRLKTFLRSSLQATELNPRNYLIVYGSEDSVKCLFNLLKLLSPLITEGCRHLYSELEVSNSKLQNVEHARIVLCDIKDRTIRVAQSTGQYHGIVTTTSENVLTQHKIPVLFLSASVSLELSKELSTGQMMTWLVEDGPV